MSPGSVRGVYPAPEMNYCGDRWTPPLPRPEKLCCCCGGRGLPPPGLLPWRRGCGETPPGLFVTVYCGAASMHSEALYEIIIATAALRQGGSPPSELLLRRWGGRPFLGAKGLLLLLLRPMGTA